MAGVDEQSADGLSDEQREVRRWRYHEARAAQLTIAEARLYADSDIDCHDLRLLVAHRCPPEEIARILL